MIRKTVTLVAAFALTCLFASSLVAQPSQDEQLPPPRFALQFQVAENFDVSSFNGSTISIRQYRNDALDRRLAISLAGDIRRRLDENDISGSETKETVLDLSVRLICQRIKPLYERGPVTAYSAFGFTLPIGFRYHPSTIQHNQSGDIQIFRKEKRQLTSWNLGLGGQLNIGVEVAHKDWLYWFVEYGVRSEISWQYSKQVRDSVIPDGAKRTSKINQYTLSLDPTQLTLGLAVMF